MEPDEHEQILEPQRSHESFSERLFGLSISKFLLAVAFILTAGTYLSLILFGDNSLSVLLQLEEYQEFLSDDIEHLKAENAALQKQYFELQELNPDSN